MFTGRNLRDIRRNEFFRGYNDKHLHECPLNGYVEIKPPFVYLRKRIWYNNSGYLNVYEDGCEIELLKIIGNANNKSLDIEECALREYCK
jgi:hypothetical protein